MKEEKYWDREISQKEKTLLHLEELTQEKKVELYKEKQSL